MGLPRPAVLSRWLAERRRSQITDHRYSIGQDKVWTESGRRGGKAEVVLNPCNGSSMLTSVDRSWTLGPAGNCINLAFAGIYYTNAVKVQSSLLRPVIRRLKKEEVWSHLLCQECVVSKLVISIHFPPLRPPPVDPHVYQSGVERRTPLTFSTEYSYIFHQLLSACWRG